MNPNELESIWAAGVPKKIKEEDFLEPKSILNMCIKTVLDTKIVPKEYRILAVNDELGKYPSLLIEKEKTVYALAVIPCIYPHYMPKNDGFRIGFADHCLKQNYIPVICPVALYSIDEERKKASIVLKGDLFHTVCLGFKECTLDENQDLSFEALNRDF